LRFSAKSAAPNESLVSGFALRYATNSSSTPACLQCHS
jgi:hypothetical protein